MLSDNVPTVSVGLKVKKSESFEPICKVSGSGLVSENRDEMAAGIWTESIMSVEHESNFTKAAPLTGWQIPARVGGGVIVAEGIEVRITVRVSDQSEQFHWF